MFKISVDDANFDLVFRGQAQGLVQAHFGIVQRGNAMPTLRQPDAVAAFPVSRQQDLTARMQVSRLIAQKPVGLCAVLEIRRGILLIPEVHWSCSALYISIY